MLQGRRFDPRSGHTQEPTNDASTERTADQCFLLFSVSNQQRQKKIVATTTITMILVTSSAWCSVPGRDAFPRGRAQRGPCAESWIQRLELQQPNAQTLPETRCFHQKELWRRCFLPPPPCAEVDNGRRASRWVWAPRSGCGRGGCLFYVRPGEGASPTGSPPVCAVGRGARCCRFSRAAPHRRGVSVPKGDLARRGNLPEIQHPVTALQTLLPSAPPTAVFPAPIPGAGELARLPEGTRHVSGRRVGGEGVR